MWYLFPCMDDFFRTVLSCHNEIYLTLKSRVKYKNKVLLKRCELYCVNINVAVPIIRRFKFFFWKAEDYAAVSDVDVRMTSSSSSERCIRKRGVTVETSPVLCVCPQRFVAFV